MHNILKMTGLGEDARWEIAGSTQDLETILNDPTLLLQQVGQINLHYTCHHVEPSTQREFQKGEWLFFDIDKIDNFRPELVPKYISAFSLATGLDSKYIWGISSGNGAHLLIRMQPYTIEYIEVHKSTYSRLCDDFLKAFRAIGLTGEMDNVFHKSKSLRLPMTINRKEGREDKKCEIIQKGEPLCIDFLTQYRQFYDKEFSLDTEVKKMAAAFANSQKSHALPVVLQNMGVAVNGIASPSEIKEKCSFVATLESEMAFLPREEWLRAVSLLATLGMEKEAHEWSMKSATYKASETEQIIQSAKDRGIHPTSCEKIGQTYSATLTAGCATCPYKSCKSPAKLFNDPTLLSLSQGFYDYYTGDDGKLKRGKLNFRELGKFCNKYLNTYSVQEHNQVYAWDFNELIYEKMSRESMAKKFNDLIQPIPNDPTMTKLKGYDTMAIEHSVKEKFVMPPEGFVPLQNGWLNVLKGDLEQYTPKWLVTQKIPVSYDPIAACPRFEAFLRERIGDPATIEVLLEYICYALCGIKYPNRKILVLEGPKGTGKTTIITALTRLFGHLSTMSQLQHLTGRFETSMFEGKRLVLFDEAPTAKDANLIELLKNLSGSPYIKIERKNENAMTIENLARLVIACNEIPRGGAIDTGFMDRLLIVPMHNQIQTYDMVSANTMIDEELSGILNLVLKRFSRLKAQNFNIEQTELTTKQADTYQQENDPVAAFIMQDLDFVTHVNDTGVGVQENSKRGSQETVIQLSNFRKEFQNWAREENPYYATLSTIQIRKHIGVLVKTIFKPKGVKLQQVNGSWYLVGVRFKDRNKLDNPQRNHAQY